MTKQPSLNQRPKQVTSFLVDGETHPLWIGANRKANRFFIANIALVAQDLDLNPTKLEDLFKLAARVIATETNWQEQCDLDYTCSHTQIYTQDRGKAKQFGRAVTAIVAMELYAAERKPNYNVYDLLRIVPATYFIDRLDRDYLKRADEYMQRLPQIERENRNFFDYVLDSIGEINGDLLNKHTFGHCLTRPIATRVCDFINAKFPRELHVGPILCAGETSISSSLGKKSAVPSLRIPGTYDVSSFGVIT